MGITLALQGFCAQKFGSVGVACSQHVNDKHIIPIGCISYNLEVVYLMQIIAINGRYHADFQPQRVHAAYLCISV